MLLDHSPITQHHFQQIPFYLKRDDLLHPHFSGNKARKLMPYLQQSHSKTTTLISYGSAQSNMLYSLSALAKLKGWQLEFYVDHIAPWLKQNPIGNYRGALDLDANVIETHTMHPQIQHPRDYIEQIRQPGSECLFIPEGGSSCEAEHGVRQLGEEILHWARTQWSDNRWNTHSPLTVALPSGTGTTALYLHKTLKPYGITVLTCPCVGDTQYLIHQFQQLAETDHPKVLTQAQKHHFGKLYRDDYRIWQALLEQTGVEFDLLYDPTMWRCLLDWYPTHTHHTLLYIHQGGIKGNESMLARYRRKFGFQD